MQAQRIWWTFSVAFACLVSQAFAQGGPATAVPAGLDACSKEPDGGRRLACYDREIAHLHQLAAAARSTSSAGAGQTSPAASATATQASSALAAGAANATSSHPVSAVPPPGTFAPPDPNNPADVDRFGLNPDMVHERQEERRAPKELPQITARISSVHYKSRGEFVVSLDNGQTWEQADHDGDVDMSVGDSVSIKSGILSAYYLRPRAGRIVRVKRIR